MSVQLEAGSLNQTNKAFQQLFCYENQREHVGHQVNEQGKVVSGPSLLRAGSTAAPTPPKLRPNWMEMGW